MSCWLLDDVHLDALLTAAIVWGPGILKTTPRLMGNVLRRVNVRSYNARYPHHKSTRKGMAYEFTLLGQTINPLVVGQAIRCYDYQACETDTWKNRPTLSEREVQGFLRLLAEAALTKFGSCVYVDSYDLALEALRELPDGRRGPDGCMIGWPIEHAKVFGPPLRVTVQSRT